MAARQSPKAFRDDICDRWRLVRSLPRQRGMQGPFQYAARTARQASDLNRVQIYYGVLFETCVTQEAYGCDR